MTSEIVGIVANVALTLSFIVALVFGVAQVRATERDRRERFSLEALRNFQTREFAELIYFIMQRHVPKSREELAVLPAEERIMFIQFSQQMESLGLLVAAGLIDIGLVDRTLGSFVTSAWEQYKTMFMNMRKNSPYEGEYFQWLAERLERQMKEHPREPFYKSQKF